jgi:hypothetical protein
MKKLREKERERENETNDLFISARAGRVVMGWGLRGLSKLFEPLGQSLGMQVELHSRVIL